MPFDSPFSALRGTRFPEAVTVAETHAISASEGVSALGTFSFAANIFSGGTVTFRAVLNVSDSALTGQAVLYNVTDAEVVSTLSTSSVSPVALSDTLTVGAGVGELRSTATVYEVRLSVSGTLSTEIVTLGSASLRIS